MNREHLYRGKTDDGEWVYGNLIETREEYSDEIIYAILEKTAEHRCCGEYCDDGWHSVVKDTIGEYTGLTDKSDNKIFEGDIVQAPSNLAGTEFYIGTIEFGNFDDYSGNIYTGFYIKWHNVPEYSTLRQSIIWWRDEPDRFLKVIGNIHDNPELLSDKT